MRGLISEIHYLSYLISVLLFFNPGVIISQDFGNHSAFRKEMASLVLEYKLEEALVICNKSDKDDREVIATKSIVYSLMGNRDKNKNYIEKGFTILKSFSSLKEDYNIHVAIAVSYGIQANQVGLKKQAELAQISVKHCKEALSLNSNLPHPNFILGRYYYELSGMSSITAKIAKKIIDEEEIDRASYELALSYLKEASKLAPHRFLYNYYTGAAYKELGNEEMALFYFHKADKNKRHTSDDFEANKDLVKQIK
jgi:tetratricopeptide (TPR) repeat protein